MSTFFCEQSNAKQMDDVALLGGGGVSLNLPLILNSLSLTCKASLSGGSQAESVDRILLINTVSAARL